MEVEEIDDGGKVYPYLHEWEGRDGTESDSYSGISRRDWLAGQFGPSMVLAAFIGVCGAKISGASEEEMNSLIEKQCDPKNIAANAYESADAMIKQSKQ